MADELNVEDLVFNEENQESDYLELPLSRQTFLLVAGAIVLVGVFSLGRIGFLNLFKGGFYASRASANVNKEIALPAPRGVVVDRFGNQLVGNKSAISVFLNVAEVLKQPDKIDALVADIFEILGTSVEGLKSHILGADLDQGSFISVARDITNSQAIKIKDLNRPYLQVTDDYARDYLDGPIFSHIVGYVGAADRANELAGRAGLEAQYNDWLKGTDGKLIVYRDASGNPIDTKVSEPPVSGKKLVATIDADLQRYFYNRLKDGLAFLGRQSGAGLALDPQSGEVLALVSLPSFDNNQVSKYLNLPNQPFFNRAISGAYTPGSTIKPLVALAALHENIVDPKYQILSTGSIEIPNPYDPEHPSRFLDWRAHGWVDLHSALARSSNVYFYELGGGFQGFKGLGIERLRDYWQRFLLGNKTGIDLPAENTGFLPAPEEKEQRTGQIWRIGDTYNVSIGQGDLLLTPLQLLNFIDSIANGGHLLRPRLVLNGSTTQSLNNLLFDYSDWQYELKEVQEGMQDTVRKPYGTANLLSTLPMPVAGKTGSSQVSNNTKTNAFFVGYAPADDPQIAILVLIENAREGSLNAVPIAKDVFNWYYENRIVNHKDAIQ